MMDSLFKSIEELAGANVPVRAFESDNANLVQTCRVSRRSRFKPRPPNALAGIYAASRHVAPEPLIDRVHRPHQSPVVFVLRIAPQTPRSLLRQIQRTERHARLANFVSRVKFEMVSQTRCHEVTDADATRAYVARIAASLLLSSDGHHRALHLK